MSSRTISEALKPINRHIIIVPHFKDKAHRETDHGVLLPEDYNFDEDKYIDATIVSAAHDCSSEFRKLYAESTNSSSSRIVVDRAMVEEITLKGKTYYSILENYVVGFLTGF